MVRAFGIVRVAAATLLAVGGFTVSALAVSPAAPTASDALAMPAVSWRAAPAPTVESLFVISSAGGTVTGVGRDTGRETLTVTLSGVSGHATQFTDRPFRRAYVLSTRDLVTRWARWFADSPPNAVLTFNEPGDPMPHSIVLTLRHPRYDRAADRLRFTARHIHRRPEASPDAVQHVDLPRRRPPARFLRGSLYIDSAGTGTVINGCDLTPVVNCPGASLTRAFLPYADLHDATLTNAHLDFGSVAYANLTNANLSGAGLGSTDMSWVHGPGAILTGAQMYQATMIGAYLPDADFQGASMGSVNLTAGADLSGANLQDALLVGAQISDANLTNADFTNANLIGADLTNATLTGANLSGATWIDGHVCGPDSPDTAGHYSGRCL